MKEKILIVDDIELNREILAVALGDEYPVMEAGDGEQGLLTVILSKGLWIKSDTPISRQMRSSSVLDAALMTRTGMCAIRPASCMYFKTS